MGDTPVDHGLSAKVLPHKPKRNISTLGLTFVAVGGVVGSGWLFGPLFAAKVAGPVSIVAWVIGGIMILIAALPFAEVAAMLPVVGGLGRLPQFSHGNVVGMFIGWVAWIGYVTAAPIETQALLEYASNESMFHWLFNEGAGTGSNPLSIGGLLVAFVFLGLFTIINAYGVKLFAQVNTPLTWFKILVPVVVVIGLLTKFDSSNFTEYGGFAPLGYRNILSAISTGGIVFSFLGFRHALDLAGEAKRPQVTLPVALIGSLTICIVLFGAIQFAFIGALRPADLANGWSGLAMPGANGPITALLAGLGMTALANLVLVDAVLGPFGAGLVASASTSRLSVAVSRNGLFPQSLQHFSARGVPLKALIFNAGVGMLILIAFRDGWQAILTFNTGAIVLSFCVGPVILLSLRKQIPDRERPFRLRRVGLVAYSAFIVVSLIVYWTGWDTLWKLSIPIAAGAALFAWRIWREGEERRNLDIRSALWLAPYFIGLLAISYAGNFGGQHWIPRGWDALLVAVFAIAMLPLAVWLRLTDQDAAKYLLQDSAEHDH